MRVCVLLSVALLAACAHRPLGTSMVVELPTKANPSTKLICASLTQERMGESTRYSCAEWMQVSVNARGWDAWGEPIHQKVAEMNPCDRYGYSSEQCREAVFAFAAMKVEEAKSRK